MRASLARPRFSQGQALPAGPLGLGQRWTVARKREVVLRLLRDEPVHLLSRQLGVEIFRLEQWREKAIGGIDASLQATQGRFRCRRELDSAMKRIGELTMQVELLGGQDGDLRPFGAAEVAAMSAATSPGTGLAYGLRRVCAAWGMARSSFYAMTSGQHAEQPPAKASGTEARDLGPGAAGGDRSRPGGIALGGRGLPQGLGSASGLSRHPCFPASGGSG